MLTPKCKTYFSDRWSCSSRTIHMYVSERMKELIDFFCIFSIKPTFVTKSPTISSGITVPLPCRDPVEGAVLQEHRVLPQHIPEEPLIDC